MKPWLAVGLLIVLLAASSTAFARARGEAPQAPRDGGIQAPLDANGTQAPRNDEPQAPVRAEEPRP